MRKRLDNIRLLLKEFDYDKNTLDDTINFLRYVLRQLDEIYNEVDNGWNQY